jgi:hypothetical protein
LFCWQTLRRRFWTIFKNRYYFKSRCFAKAIKQIKKKCWQIYVKIVFHGRPCTILLWMLVPVLSYLIFLFHIDMFFSHDLYTTHAYTDWILVPPLCVTNTGSFLRTMHGRESWNLNLISKPSCFYFLCDLSSCLLPGAPLPDEYFSFILPNIAIQTQQPD